MRPLVLLSSLLGLGFAFPQRPEWAQAGNAASKFGSGGSWGKSGGKGFGSSKKTEELQYQILENHDDYLVVRTPSSNWACTSMDVSSSEDPYKDWQSKYEGNALAAMGANKGAPSSQMFQKLFRYIVGVNSESKNIEMTAPVTNKIEEFDDGKSYKDEMCFWLGSEHDKTEPPQPNDDDVTIQKRPSMEFFVRKFGGWALSSDDWAKELVTMEESLQDREDAEYKGVFYTVGYDSPFVPANARRNEIWMPKESTSANSAELQATTGKPDGEDYKSKFESLPYKVLSQKKGYEVREYPAAKVACTKMLDVVPSKDPMNGWQEKFDNNPLAAMAASKQVNKKDKAPRNRMFMRLFKYILGVNSEGEEIEMTTPVPTTHFAKLTASGEAVDDLEDQEMCFWLGTPWQDTQAPQPIKDNVYVTEKPKLLVYVRQFGGFAFSDSDYRMKYNEFKQSLASDGLLFEDKVWKHASYNSPWDMGERRNEIWIPVEGAVKLNL